MNEIVDAQPVESPAAPHGKQVVADAARVPEPDARRGKGRKLGANLNAPELYLNRELTWLAFNQRVLHEAEDERTPLLERVKFLAIVSSNLDEFFMKRIGGLKQQQAAGIRQRTVDGRSPEEQIQACHEVIGWFQSRRAELFSELRGLLREQGIVFAEYGELSTKDRESLRAYYLENIFPVVTPLAMDPGHPFPFISNLALNLLVTLRYPNGTALHMARVKVPVSRDVSPRFLKVGDGHTFVRLEDVMANNLDLLFPGMSIESCELFRVTRNANVEMDEEHADDLLEMIKTELRERHFAPIVRLEVQEAMAPVHRGMLAAELGLDEMIDVFEERGLIAMRDLFEIAGLDLPGLRDKPHQPIDNPDLNRDRRNIFHILRERGPVLLQHPYESFATSVERFLRKASSDPKVLAIKMTLYRTSAKGKIIESLINAARNGKQVAVLVELKARFDEAANIHWATSLEQAGIHVTYGVVGLKTHSKIVLVVRKDYDGLRRYMHVGTGNYNADTARLYTDLGMLTCDPEMGQDLTELFNYLTGYAPPLRFRRILAAPHTLKKALLEKIDREIGLHSEDSPGRIQFKMNALEDADITRALYKATQAGVKVDLIVRDTCRFRPGLPGLSETGQVISIVGRFLEHSRIYYFRNGGSEEYYFGSADLMKRNLESRVEVVAPVVDPELREQLRLILDIQLADRRSAWEMQPDGSYVQRSSANGQDDRSSQDYLVGVAEARRSAAAKHKSRQVNRRLAKRFRRKLEGSAPKS